MKERLGTTKGRYGSYSAAISVVVLAILVVVNLIASSLPGKYTKIDTSDSSYYSIGDLTKNIVGRLVEPGPAIAKHAASRPVSFP